MSLYTRIVFINGKSTTCPGPIVHGPPMIETNLTLIPRVQTVFTAICNAAPVALFSLSVRGLK